MCPWVILCQGYWFSWSQSLSSIRLEPHIPGWLIEKCILSLGDTVSGILVSLVSELVQHSCVEGNRISLGDTCVRDISFPGLSVLVQRVEGNRISSYCVRDISFMVSRACSAFICWGEMGDYVSGLLVSLVTRACSAFIWETHNYIPCQDIGFPATRTSISSQTQLDANA